MDKESISDLKEITKIFIIESPSKEDVSIGRREGLALSETLTLTRIQNSCITVTDEASLIDNLIKISDEIKIDQKKWGAITLHFSLHGNENGVSLMSGEFIDWKHFYRILKPFNDKLGYIDYKYLPKFVPINLHLSVCEGFKAKIIKGMGEESPFISLVGPICAVDWADSLIAFTAYYHNIIHKKTGIKKAVEIMNQVNGFKDVFQVDLIDFFELN